MQTDSTGEIVIIMPLWLAYSNRSRVFYSVIKAEGAVIYFWHSESLLMHVCCSSLIWCDAFWPGVLASNVFKSDTVY